MSRKVRKVQKITQPARLARKILCQAVTAPGFEEKNFADLVFVDESPFDLKNQRPNSQNYRYYARKITDVPEDWHLKYQHQQAKKTVQVFGAIQ